MVKGEELGLSPIKTIYKEGTEELKKIHYSINDIMFKYKKRNISRLDAEEIYSLLCDYGKKLTELKVPEKAWMKRDEILSKVRAAALTVKHYIKEFKWSDRDIADILNTFNWQTKQMMDAKNSGEIFEDPVKYLNMNKEIYERFYLDSKGKIKSINIDNFINFNEEILQIVESKYSLTPSL